MDQAWLGPGVITAPRCTRVRLRRASTAAGLSSRRLEYTRSLEELVIGDSCIEIFILYRPITLYLDRRYT